MLDGTSQQPTIGLNQPQTFYTNHSLPVNGIGTSIFLVNTRMSTHQVTAAHAQLGQYPMVSLTRSANQQQLLNASQPQQISGVASAQLINVSPIPVVSSMGQTYGYSQPPPTTMTSVYQQPFELGNYSYIPISQSLHTSQSIGVTGEINQSRGT
ncbi:hypothetical protein Bhyg_17532 [Pseudolycoriella hygida]|uniref:Uncharacterized protein n=1 Tax=Pseudolycoriella hygida TaxID=35572 RepID=A0A9Q0MKQ9_9DIPT|nr:hypothetical protein Bhyg_17532 [Pseudolycoriella hygida]